jgi:hypothetical protein
LGDAGAAGCKIVRGPIQQPFRAAAEISTTKPDVVDVILNDDGRPRAFTFPAGAIDRAAKPVKETAANPVTGLLSLPCEIGGAYTFCPDKTGAVHRIPLAPSGSASAAGASGSASAAGAGGSASAAGAGGEGTVVASSRAGSRIAAATLAGDHALLAYLASRKTGEGFVSEAWIAIDDASPVRLSEDGSGATSVILAPRGPSVVAVMLDGRSALTAVHARVLSFKGKLYIGTDSVLYVAGPPERHTAAALATPASGAGFVLLPIAKDAASFGLAAIRVDAEPVVDVPVVWSMYPNGVDPAPVAATQGHANIYVARVRPEGASASAAKVLELGELHAEGTFIPRGIVATSGTPSDVNLFADNHGAIWLSYTDSAGSWLERRVCY